MDVDRTAPSTIRSRLLVVQACRLLGWQGRTMGIDAVHAWRIEPAAV